MNTIKAKDWSEVPQDYVGIIEWSSGIKGSYKNGKLHKEDGPAYIGKNGYKEWNLNGIYIWTSTSKLDLINQIILSKQQHPKYPLVQVWKILGPNGLYEFVVIPGMEEYIQE